MFDTMTLTKLVGGFCGALLLFLLGNWAAEGLYHTGGGHGDDEHHMAGYVIATGEGEADAEPEEEVSFTELLAAADPAKGEKVFAKCKACHKVDGSNATGPHLDGVVNRAVGTVADFRYSGKLVAVADVWTPEHLNDFLANPKGFAPGTAMSFAGLKKIEDRANVIAYLESIGG